ncbi:MAG TPA: TrmJ/YjtD family RNA methyltransferase [Gemmataceae bacterium]|jgi:tRNA/rRNA methyltransferase
MNCRVVLVRPRIAANIGAAARAMRNMGLSDLVLVAPEADPADERSRLLATHGEDVLERCRIVANMGEAVADCVLVAATSARVGGLMRRQFVGPPDEIAPRLIEAMRTGPVALVFGPESSGLTNTEVTRCHYLIHIPTDPACPALNLAQAVAICIYELRRHWLRQTTAPTLLLPTAAPAPFADQERAFEQLRQALEDVHFLWNEKADALMHALRHLIGRAGPTPMEVDVLLGLARQLRWFARNRK